MSYRGDIRLGDTIDVKFTTRRFSTGAPFTLAGTPAVSAYVGNSTTQITAGITLTVDFDAVTGLNNVRVVASGANGYATASNYDLVITAGTVDSVSVVGEVIGSFSIEARSALMPTTAARTLDVTATGAAGIDWANVEGATTAVNLSATNIDTDQVVASVSGAVGSVTGAVGSVTGAVGSVTGNVGGNVVGSVASVTAAVTVGTINAGVITAAAIATDAIDSDALAASAVTEIQSGLSTLDAAGVRTAVGLASANLDTQLDALPTAAEIVAAQLTTAITEAYRANGAAPTLAQFMSEVLAHLGEVSINGTTKTLKKLDHATSAATFTLNSPSKPTTITRAT